MEAGWLEQSLREAAEEAKRIPEWARQVLDAHEAYYGPQRSRLHRDHVANAEPSRPSEASWHQPFVPNRDR
jgi:hypothetical protein